MELAPCMMAWVEARVKLTSTGKGWTPTIQRTIRKKHIKRNKLIL